MINEAIKGIEELTNSDDSWVVEKANKILRYNHQHTTGQISTAEYVDLLNDLARIEEIQDNADVMKLKAAVENVLMTAMKLV